MVAQCPSSRGGEDENNNQVKIIIGNGSNIEMFSKIPMIRKLHHNIQVMTLDERIIVLDNVRRV
jgi:hypothetical protein